MSVDRSRFSVFLVTCFVCVRIVGIVFVGVRVCLTTVIVIVIIAGINCVVLDLVLLLFELMALLSVLAFCSGGNLTWVFLDFVLSLVVSQNFSTAHLELPSFSILIPFQGVTQSVEMPFSECVSVIDFFRLRSILAFMNCSMITIAATPNASFAVF